MHFRYKLTIYISNFTRPSESCKKINNFNFKQVYTVKLLLACNSIMLYIVLSSIPKVGKQLYD